MFEASPPTGNLLYAVTERYVDALGVKEHMKIGAERWSGFPELAELIRDFGCFAQPNGVQLTTLKDTAEACKTRKGDVTLSLGIVVPASKERELDALFALHEAFMRDTHACAGDVANPLHDDGKTPRLTHFSVNKAFELVDPFDETKGFTGAVQYSIAETYVNANGVEGHFSFKERYPEVFEGVVKNFTDPAYARFADVGGGRVVAAQSSKWTTSRATSSEASRRRWTSCCPAARRTRSSARTTARRSGESSRVIESHRESSRVIESHRVIECRCAKTCFV